MRPVKIRCPTCVHPCCHCAPALLAFEGLCSSMLQRETDKTRQRLWQIHSLKSFWSIPINALKRTEKHTRVSRGCEWAYSWLLEGLLKIKCHSQLFTLQLVGIQHLAETHWSCLHSRQVHSSFAVHQHKDRTLHLGILPPDPSSSIHEKSKIHY